MSDPAGWREEGDAGPHVLQELAEAHNREQEVGDLDQLSGLKRGTLARPPNCRANVGNPIQGQRSAVREPARLFNSP